MVCGLVSKSNSGRKFHVPFQKPIVLVGLMGAGKTSIGRKLAERMQISFIDADHEIEKAAGCTITEFFEKFGEKEFRRGEKRVIERLLIKFKSLPRVENVYTYSSIWLCLLVDTLQQHRVK